MAASSSVAIDQSKSVAFIISHTIKAGEEQRYEEWTREILNAVSSFPGYLGREVFLPTRGNRKYTVIVRFDNDEHLNNWAEYEIRSGIDFWFTPEGVKPPSPWKQFLLTLSAVYPLSLIIPRLLSPLFNAAPALGQQLVKGLLIAATLTALLTFVIMPRYTRLVKQWLYKEAS